jgi:hypothetical protein
MKITARLQRCSAERNAEDACVVNMLYTMYILRYVTNELLLWIPLYAGMFSSTCRSGIDALMNPSVHGDFQVWLSNPTNWTRVGPRIL